MIQLRTIKILTETNQKNDRNWLKTLCHPQSKVKVGPYQVIVGPDHQS